MASVEQRAQAIGRELFERTQGQKPGIFDKARWSGEVLEWAMKEEGFKTEMFRFVDAFPVLKTPEEIWRHLQEYLLDSGVAVPAVIKMALKGAGLGKLTHKVAASQITKNLEGMAHNFIAGAAVDSALSVLAALRDQRQAFTVDLLGEATLSEREADDYATRYRQLIEGLIEAAPSWAEDPLLDQDDRGPLPKVNVSIKISAMYSQIDGLALEESVTQAAARLIPLFQLAKEKGAFINLDLEQYALKEVTFGLFKRVMEDPSLEGFEDAGVVIQAYLRDAEADLAELIKWAKAHKKRITVRLVKGAYWDYETVAAEQLGWPSPVWLDKVDSDACFERCSELMLKHHKNIRSAFGTHNLRSIAKALALAERYKVPKSGFEVQCLYGMAEPIKAACVGAGLRVRTYATIGELIPGMAYLVRRLLENTSNQSWLRMGLAEKAEVEVLLAEPKAKGRDPMLRAIPAEESKASAPGPFLNEPPRDLTRPPQRAAFKDALDKLRLGQDWGPIIGGERIETQESKDSLDPADGVTVVGRVGQASEADALRAIEIAKAAAPAWRDAPAGLRAGHLLKLAALMRAERDALAALMIREVGKTWREADADVVEAIDFCEYYAREALRLDKPQRMQRVPGETNDLFYQGRGVAAVIAPWNFPLAILTGMATAALVSGNAVLLKPATDSMVIAARFAALALKAGFPGDIFHFLPGPGRAVGEALINSPDVQIIAFTGSLEVGLHIWEKAGRTPPNQPALKSVICEMGGKNALIVDSDADLDEAVHAVIKSAYGYSGQKCSACSRVIVLQEQYDAFIERFVEAAASLKVGDPRDPATAVGPVINMEVKAKLEAAIQRGKETATLLLGAPHAGPGAYVNPTIFGDVRPDDALAQEEFFGPIVAVMKAATFDEALDLANGTAYALTGGLISRSPARIAEARRRFKVGNLYINRNITGAIVGRQPFGGFKMSGGGTKAGGPDYLLHFMDPRLVTENTLRRGFAPSEEG
ncbi:proline dehydrogenase family protein [Myxococcota bacterium]|nr:proline dehydrogenase family protein [Myxococcota bacterium]MBU1432571.1 proline dehydrogenase family protein [Myxococcota bacterium]